MKLKFYSNSLTFLIYLALDYYESENISFYC